MQALTIAAAGWLMSGCGVVSDLMDGVTVLLVVVNKNTGLIDGSKEKVK
jgi:hypothetical protein